MKRFLVVTAALLLIAAAAVLVRRTTPAEPRLVLPAVDRFAPGACRDAAGDLRSLARVTHRAGVAAVSTADRAELRRVQARLGTLRPAAAADVREPMADLVLALGYLRIRLDSRTADAGHLHAVEAARADLEKTCVRAR